MKFYLYKNIFLRGCILFSSIAFSSFTYADLEMTHIMYNPEGADEGYEYVIVKNTDDVSIDISQYYFLENDTHHGLYPETPSLISGATAWVVKDIDVARSRYGDNNYVKSSFSLNNTGETLAFSNSEKNIINEFTYTSDMGGNGDGNALVIGSRIESPTGSDDVSSSSDTSSIPTTSKQKTEDYEPYYEAYIDIPDTVIATTDVPIKAGVFYRTKYKDIHKKAGYYYLNFGNGYGQEYTERIETTYSYLAAGTYQLTLEYYRSNLVKEYDEPNVVLHKEITVVAPSLSIVSYDSFKGVTLKNLARTRINLEGWHIVSGSDIYTFPKYSSIAAGQELVIAREHTGFTVPIAQTLQLLNPDYLTIHDYSRFSYHVASFNGDSKKETLLTVDSIDTQDIDIGENIIIQSDSNYIENREDRVVFREDSLVDMNAQSTKRKNTNLPLWILTGFIMLFAFLKSFLKKPLPQKNLETEEVYNIELIE